jgi:hypothetical protein
MTGTAWVKKPPRLNILQQMEASPASPGAERPTSKGFFFEIFANFRRIQLKVYLV